MIRFISKSYHITGLGIGRYYFLILLLVPILISVSIPSTFAQTPVTFVTVPYGTSVPGCEETNSCFLPYSVTVNVGDQVMWLNEDTAAHTV